MAENEEEWTASNAFQASSFSESDCMELRNGQKQLENRIGVVK